MAATTLQIKILADATQAAATMDKAATRAGGFGSAMRKAALPAAALIAGLGIMGKNAADDARGQAILAKTLQHTANATQNQVAATEDWITKTALATGVADDQLRPALAALARATGDVGKSQEATSAALDISAATGKDVTQVANAIAKAYGGNTAALSRLVPGMSKSIVKSKDMSKIMAELARVTGGSAAAAAQTVSGRMERAALAMDEAKEAAGAALLPAMGALAGVFARVVAFGQKHETTMKIVVIVVAALAAAVIALNAVMTVSAAVTTISGYATKTYAGETKLAAAASKVWAGVQWALNAAMSANPIGIIIIAIIALVAVIVLAYKKSDTFRRIVNAAWKGIQAAIGAVWRWLKTNVFAPLVAYYTTLYKAAGAAVDLIVKAWEGMKSPLMAVWNWIKSHVIDPLTDAFDAVYDTVQKVVEWVKKIKLPWPIQKAVDWITGKSARAAAPPAPPTAPAVRGRGARAAPPATGSTGTGNAALAALTPESQVIVQVSDRKMAQLVDVSIRASATSAARNLTRRRTVTV